MIFILSYKFIQNPNGSENIPDSQDMESAPHSPYDWKISIINVNTRKTRNYRINLQRYDSNTKNKTVGFFIGYYTTRDDAERIKIRVGELLEDDRNKLEPEHIRRIIQLEANNSRRFVTNSSIPGLHDEIRQWVADLTFLRTSVNLTNSN
jgi:hypothetical protein